MDDRKLSRLYILMANELFDRITPAEQKELQEMIEDDSEAMELWQEFQTSYASEEIKHKVREFIQQDDSEVLMKAIRQRSRLRRFSQLSVAAACILAVAFGLKQYFFQPSQQTNRPTIVAGAAVPSTGLSIRLASGKMVDLSTVTRLQEGNILLQNDTVKHILQYTCLNESGSEAGENLFTVPAGRDYHLQLPDGTDIFLNSASQVSFPESFSGSSREVAINGEAFLNVAQDASRPFFAHLPTGSVQVLGTSFNVNTYDSASLKVSLKDGAVAFLHNDHSTRLVPGQQVVLNRTSNQVKVQPTAAHDLSWTTGVYVLDHMPLKELQTLLPRWYGVQVVFDNNTVSKETISVTLNKEKPVEQLLAFMQMAINCNYYFKAGVLHLY